MSAARRVALGLLLLCLLPAATVAGQVVSSGACPTTGLMLNPGATCWRSDTMAEYVWVNPTSGWVLQRKVDTTTGYHALASDTFTAITATSAPAGTLMYCTTCAPSTNPCTGSSTGALALRQGTVWQCL